MATVARAAILVPIWQATSKFILLNNVIWARVHRSNNGRGLHFSASSFILGYVQCMLQEVFLHPCSDLSYVQEVFLHPCSDLVPTPLPSHRHGHVEAVFLHRCPITLVCVGSVPTPMPSPDPRPRLV